MEGLYKLLTIFHGIADDYGIEYWLDCGTSLGIIGSNSFIPLESDLDVSVLRERMNDTTIDSMVDRFKKSVGLVANASDFGIKTEKHIEGIVSSVNLDRLSNNPVKLTKTILKQVVGNRIGV